MHRVFEVGFVGLLLVFMVGCGEIEKPRSQIEIEAYQLDILFVQADHAELCMAGAGYQLGCRNVDSSNNRAVAMDDLNGDDVLDAVFGTDNSPNTLCLGGQLGGLSCDNLNLESTTTLSVSIGDLNGDEHLDLIFGNEGANQFCLNNGEASFTCRNLETSDLPTRSVALGDLNLDGNQDIVFANEGTNQVCINNGAATFVCQNVGDTSDVNGGVGLGDLNGDTFLDAVFVSVDQPNQTCLGNGSGEFVCKNLGDSAGKANSIALGDFVEEVGEDVGEEDQLPVIDLVIAATDGYYVCTGDGSGGISSCKEEINNVNTIGMTSGYLNGDNHLDVVFVRETGPSRICVGDGAGKLRCRTHNFRNSTGAYGVAMGRFAPYLGIETE